MLLALLLLATSIHDSAAYQEATAFYQRVELEKALVLLQRALPDASSDTERSQVYAWIGLVEGQLGHLERSRVALGEAVRLDATVELPAPAPPAVTSILDEIRAEAKAAAAAAAPPTAPPATAPSAAQTSTDPPLLSPPVVTMLAGAGAVVLGGAVIVIGLDTVYRQAMEAPYQSEALALRDTGYLEYAVGGTVAAAGAATIVVGAALLALE